MKKLYTLLAALVITASTFAQAPEKMSYQAVVRDSGANLVSGQQVGMRISILKDAVAIYEEIQTPMTNANGLVSIVIGDVNLTAFADIDWSTGTYFIKTEIDPTGPLTNYTITGTSQLLSVPFALHATNGQDSGTNAGDMQYWNGSSWDVVAATPNENATLQMIGGVPTWTGGTPPPPPVIGDTYAGGILFHIYEAGEDGYVLGEFHGLVCATTDQSTGLQWSLSDYDNVTVPNGAISTTDGSANTTAIIEQTGSLAANTYAAGICRLYNATGDGGLNDWYLPSKNELNLMYENIGQGDALGLGNIGGFNNDYYWSSTEVDNEFAWYQLFAIGFQSDISKRVTLYVRAVRTF